MHLRLALPVLLVRSLFGLPQCVRGAGYALVKVADTSSLSPFNGIGVPSINNSRVVSFQATNKTTVQGIYTWSGGPLNPVLLATAYLDLLYSAWPAVRCP